MSGIQPHAVVEWDRHACNTLRLNKRKAHPLAADWPVFETDVRGFEFDGLRDKVDILTGGPPCQPFSLGGKHQSHADSRDMFPATVAAIRVLRPRAFVIENVRGLTRSAFDAYFSYINLQLTFPEIGPREEEDWSEHLARLERERTRGSGRRGLTYRVLHRVLDAADYGVPQRRHRVFLVGFRSDIDAKWSFEDIRQTHSREALIESKWVTGEYWESHRIPSKERAAPPANLRKTIDRLRQSNLKTLDQFRPWRTVRDAIHDLPAPTDTGTESYQDHIFQPGARKYPGHTGSPLDEPSKALKAGDHGVPGGENMIAMSDGSVRYFTVRESARIQTFPDTYEFSGSWTEIMRQLGNAVPVKLARTVISSVTEKIIESQQQNRITLLRRLSQ